MVDTPTSRLGLRRQAVGANRNTWGLNGNEAMDAIDQAVAGVALVPLASSTYTLDYRDFAACEARNAVLRIIGSVGDAVITVPARPKTWVVINDLSGGGTVTFVTAAQSPTTGATIPADAVGIVVCEVAPSGVATCALASPSAFGGRRLQAVGEPMAPDDAAPAGWVEHLVGMALFHSAQGVPVGEVVVAPLPDGGNAVMMDLDTGYSFAHVAQAGPLVLGFGGSMPLDGDLIVTLDLFHGGAAGIFVVWPDGCEFPNGQPPVLSEGWDCITFRLSALTGRVQALAKTGWAVPAP